MIQMITTTPFNHIKSELVKQDMKQQVREHHYKLSDMDYQYLWYNKGKQYVSKIIQYDQDVKEIVNDLFGGYMLDRHDTDDHFKKTFINHFAKRQINQQTIEEFKFQLVSVFLTHAPFINRIYRDMDNYILQVNESDQQNTESNNGNTTTDNRSATADLPQDSNNLDVDNTVMDYPTDNTISRNKEKENQKTEGKTNTTNKSYNLDELFKTNGLLESVLNEFDKKCFLQIW